MQHLSYVSVAGKEDTKAILDIPINPFYAKYDSLSFLYGKPIINGYFHWSADTQKARAFIDNPLLKRYECAPNGTIPQTDFDYKKEELMDRAMINLLVGNGIHTIVVHKDYKFYHPVCKNVRVRLTQLAPFITSLEKTQDGKEKQLSAQVFEGRPSFTVYFPQDGIFYLDGLYIATTKPVPFLISQNGQLSEFPYSWALRPDKTSMEISPKYTISIPVKKATTLTVQSYYEVENTWFSLWYRYVPDEKSETVPFTSRIQKIFDDENASVYRIQ